MDSFLWNILKNIRLNRREQKQRFSENKASFLQLYSSNQASMKLVLDQFHDIIPTVEKIQNETMNRIKVAAVAAVAGALLAVSAASDSEGLSFAVYGATVACGLVALLCFIIRQELLKLPHVNRMIRLMEEFRLIVKELKNSLVEVKRSCGNLCKETVGAEAMKFIRLEINILELFYIIEKPGTFEILKHDPEQAEVVVERIFDRFRKIKTDLETFYS